MKTAFARWDDRIAPVFDTAREVFVVETEFGRIVHEEHTAIPADLLVQKALRLVELGVGTLVCGAISKPMHGLIVAYGIEVIPFVAGNLREVVEAWLHGRLRLAAFAMPGCRGRARQRFMGAHGAYQEVRTMQGKGRGRGAGGGRKQGQGGQRSGRMGGSMAAGATGTCVCPQCGESAPHERGVPCVERRCPKCGTAMTRQ